MLSAMSIIYKWYCSLKKKKTVPLIILLLLIVYVSSLTHKKPDDLFKEWQSFSISLVENMKELEDFEYIVVDEDINKHCNIVSSASQITTDRLINDHFTDQEINLMRATQKTEEVVQ